MVPSEPIPKKPSRRHWSFALGGGREFLVILILLVLLTKLSSTFLPLLVLIGVPIAVYWYVRGCFYFGRMTGVVGTLAMLIGIISFLGIQWQAHQSNLSFLTQLQGYDTVSVSRDGIFPTSPIDQLFLSGSIRDDQLEELGRMPELNGVTRLFVRSVGVTDRGLTTIDRWTKLRYVLIDTANMSDEAIIEFRDRHPVCTVIASGRDLGSDSMSVELDDLNPQSSKNPN